MAAMCGRQGAQLWFLMALVAGSITLSAALPSLIRWDPIRQVWVDMGTKGVVTVTSNSVTNPLPGQTLAAPATVVAAAPTYTQQGETRPQKASEIDKFPLIIPDAEWFKDCGKNLSDVLTLSTTKCDYFKDFVNCQQLADMGYLPPGVQSFVPGGNLNGGFTLPNGCSAGNLGIEYDGLKMVFNSPQIPILAVIAKDIHTKVYYFGSGVTQGRLLNILMKKAEFCYAPPSISPLYVSKTAAYSVGMQPGTAAWSFFKTVALAPPFSNNVASLFRGDTADVTWTLSIQKTGTDTMYQGAVSGQITITNPQNVPVTVYNVNDYVQGGPQSQVSCGTPVPFTIQPCSSTVCSYMGYWPTSPGAGSYTNLADVQYSVGNSGVMGNQVGTAIFQVAQITDAVGMMNTAVGTIPSGQAIVQDGMAPQAYYFTGTAQQSYTTQLTCPETAILTNEAVLTAATGQQLRQTATVQKLCFDLQVRVAQVASPYVGKWGWEVTKTANKDTVLLKPAETAWDRYVRQQMDLAIASGQDPSTAMKMITGGQNFSSLSSEAMPGTTNEEVTYTVTFTRKAPASIVGGSPAFQSVGDVFITNTSPLNAQLKEVTVTITNPFGGLPYTTTAACPMLTVAAGQTLQCRYVATPTFNPVGAQISASAIYLNNRNGVPTGATTAFTSSSLIVGGGPPARRRLQAAHTEGTEEISLANVLGNLLKPQTSSSRDGPATFTINTDVAESLTAIAGNATHPLAGIGSFLTSVAKNLQAAGDSEALTVTAEKKPIAINVSVSSNTTASTPIPAPAPTPSTTVAAGSSQPAAPTTPAAPAPTTFDYRGLQQECVEVRDLFARGGNYITGMLVAGSFPSGRICETTTFTYTVRYGPYQECWEKQAANQAGWFSQDTQTGGNVTNTINVKVQGCGAPVAAKAKSYAVWAKKSHSWAVSKSVSPPSISVGPKKVGKATYTIDYVRTEVLVNPKMSTTLQFDNLAGTSAVTLSDFTYSITQSCPAGQKQKSGTFKCPATTIPAGGAPLACQLQADLMCVGPGLIVAYAKAKDKTVTSIPFSFPEPKSIDTLTDSECAIVVDEFDSGTGLVVGNVTSGIRPYGKLCGSKQFTYTVSFGPFDTCGKKKATNVASLTTGAPTKSARATTTLVVDVAGCDVYTPMKASSSSDDAQEILITEMPDSGTDSAKRTAAPRPAAHKPVSSSSGSSKSKASLAAGKGGSSTTCVSSVNFWKNCMMSGTLSGRCAVVLKLPTGPQTAFFPMPTQRVTRTYKGVMSKTLSSGVKAVDMWHRASQAVIATQLNELAGVKLPAPVRDALSLVGAAVSSTNSVPPVLTSELQGVPNAVTLMEKFSAGNLGVPLC